MKLIKPVILAIVCGVLLMLSNQQMRTVIEDNQRAYEEQVLRDMVGGRHLEKADIGWQIIEDGAVIGELQPVTTHQGYNGDIDLYVAWSQDGSIINVRVSQHRETPGIGDIIEPGVSDWVLSFNGRDAEAVGRIDSISGATITTRAVTNAVEGVLPR